LIQQLRPASPSLPVFSYSRSNPALLPANFSDPASFRPGGDLTAPCLWISFGPIWHFAPFLQCIAQDFPDRLEGLRGLIACSSSSAITKRFAFNRYDRELVASLTTAEDQLLDTCSYLQVPCRILRPTLIYGRVGPYSDNNISRLVQLMRQLRFLPLPEHTGLRQPIHARQLAAVAFHLLVQFLDRGWDTHLPRCIALGGDNTISYYAMLRALQQALPPGDPARCCRLLKVPNQLFFLGTAPLLLRSPKAYEAILRLGADLAGFTPSYQLTARPPQSFPVPD